VFLQDGSEVSQLVYADYYEEVEGGNCLVSADLRADISDFYESDWTWEYCHIIGGVGGGGVGGGGSVGGGGGSVGSSVGGSSVGGGGVGGGGDSVGGGS
jgi:hypothetical protein